MLLKRIPSFRRAQVVSDACSGLTWLQVLRPVPRTNDTNSISSRYNFQDAMGQSPLCTQFPEFASSMRGSDFQGEQREVQSD